MELILQKMIFEKTWKIHYAIIRNRTGDKYTGHTLDNLDNRINRPFYAHELIILMRSNI